jgi:hypothetical protein
VNAAINQEKIASAQMIAKTVIAKGQKMSHILTNLWMQS